MYLPLLIVTSMTCTSPSPKSPTPTHYSIEDCPVPVLQNTFHELSSGLDVDGRRRWSEKSTLLASGSLNHFWISLRQPNGYQKNPFSGMGKYRTSTPDSAPGTEGADLLARQGRIRLDFSQNSLSANGE